MPPLTALNSEKLLVNRFRKSISDTEKLNTFLDTLRYFQILLDTFRYFLILLDTFRCFFYLLIGTMKNPLSFEVE